MTQDTKFDFIEFIAIGIAFLIGTSIIVIGANYAYYKINKNILYNKASEKIISSIDTAVNTVKTVPKIINDHATEEERLQLPVMVLNIANNHFKKTSNTIVSYNFIKWPINSFSLSTYHPHEFKKWLEQTVNTDNVIHFYNEQFDVNSIKEKKNSYLFAAIGIIDKNSSFLGTIIANIDLKKILILAKEQLKNPYLNFLILDNNGQPLSYTIDNSLPFIKENLAGNFGYLKNNFKQENYRYIFYKKSPNYPYMTVIGENIAYFDKSFISNTYKYLVQAWVITAALMAVMLYWQLKLHKYLKTIAVLSDYIKEIDDTPQLEHTPIKELENLTNLIQKTANDYKELQLNNQELEKSNKTLDENNQNIQEELLNLSKELEQEVQYKNLFIQNIKNDLFIPLNNLINLSETIVAYWYNLDDDKKLQINSNIRDITHKLQKKAKNCLNHSKFFNSDDHLKIEENDIEALLINLIQEVAPLYKNKKDLTIKLNKQENCSYKASFDKSHIKQLLKNVLSTSIKSLDSGIIECELSRTIIAQDTGQRSEGLSLEISNRNINQDNECPPLTRYYKDSPMLKMCENIILAHHGQIMTKNNYNSSKLTFIIPVSQP